MRPHVVWIRYGDLPKRLEPCPLHGCRVDEDGLTSCEHLACWSCGIGPLAVVRPEVDGDEPIVLYCEACRTRVVL